MFALAAESKETPGWRIFWAVFLGLRRLGSTVAACPLHDCRMLAPWTLSKFFMRDLVAPASSVTSLSSMVSPPPSSRHAAFGWCCPESSGTLEEHPKGGYQLAMVCSPDPSVTALKTDRYPSRVVRDKWPWNVQGHCVSGPSTPGLFPTAATAQDFNLQQQNPHDSPFRERCFAPQLLPRTRNLSNARAIQ